MRKRALGALSKIAALALLVPNVFPQTPAKPEAPKTSAIDASGEPIVEFEMMTWPEVKAALAAGKTTALFYTGGTEQRGPQNVNGGHNLMAKATAKAIAPRLGSAIAMPVLPYTPNNASAELPGTIGLTDDLLAAILVRISEQAITTGFKNVILMGDHGGGQPRTYAEVARKLDEKYEPQGIHVYYCNEVYKKAMKISIVGCWPTGIRSARTLAFLTRRKCSTSGATKAGSARNS